MEYERLWEKLLHQLKQTHRKCEGEQAGEPELRYAIRHGVLSNPRCVDFALQVVPIPRQREHVLNRVGLRHAFSKQSFVSFFQVLSEFCMHFFLLGSAKLQAREALTNELLPIRHYPPSLTDRRVLRR